MLKKTILLIFTFATMTLNAQIERVEPSFWWVGMKNPQLQLLIHGTEICNRKVQIDYPGVKVIKVNRACSPNYLFVTLVLESGTVKAGRFTIMLTQPDKPTITVNYELKDRQPESANREGFTSADVMYLIMPDRFANGDPSNDNIASLPDKTDRTKSIGRHGGDIKVFRIIWITLKNSEQPPFGALLYLKIIMKEPLTMVML